MAERQGADLLRALGVASAVAIPISLVALAFLALVEQVTTWVWSDIPTAAGFAPDSWWWVLLIPTVGGVLAGLAVRHLAGGGGHDPIDGFSAKPVAPDAIPGVVLAALASLAFGAVVGPEAPLVALGSALGLWGARLFRQSGSVAALAGSAGLFAAIAALFGNPLLAAFLVLEAVGATALAAPLTVVVLPGLLAAGLGYVVFTGVGEWAGVAPTSLTIDGLASYPALRLADVLWAVVIGVAMALVGLGVRFVAARTHGFAAPRPAVAAPIGGLAVGGLALVFGLSGESPLNVLFSGESDLSTVVGQGPGWGAGIVALLILTKAAAYGVSLGSGFRGGPVFPALFLGAAVGTLFSLVVPGLELTPAVVAGMAAGSAAMLRLPVSSVMLAVVVAGSAGLEASTLAIVGSVVSVVVTLAGSSRQARTNQPHEST
ncbi:MAG: chloride channel protein [Jiangellales bacterium]